MDSRIVLRMGLLFVLALGVAGCGSDSEIDPNESARTREIRDKVRADLEADRLKRLAPRIAHATESAASSATAALITEVAAVDGAENAAEAADAMSDATPLEIGEKLYAANCSSCHGVAGGSDGPIAATLVPKPSQHNDGGYMNALSNDYIFQVINEGGAAVGKSAMMAPWGTSLSDDEMWGLVAFVRSLASPPYEGPEI
ncbi:MAG: cytochrome c [Myxococcota bacterium]